MNEILTLNDEQPEDKYGCEPEKRTTKELLNYGIIVINKPRGPTSHQVADYVKKIVGADKSGHSGTLDPDVSGVLPTALGEATKITGLMLKSPKEYIGIMHLHSEVNNEKLAEGINTFIGTITQLPPRKSAVKREERQREIYEFEILEREEKEILFRVKCQAGTYIRKLIHDLGITLKTGAHMAQLVRTKAGPFTDKEMISLQDLTDAIHIWKEKNDETELRKIIKPIERLTENLPKLWARNSAVNSLTHGAHLNIPGIAKVEKKIQKGDMVAVMTLKNELVCIGTAYREAIMMQAARRGTAIIVDRVFMHSGVYPKYEKEKKNYNNTTDNAL